jgi:hypothetical protein
MVLSRDMKYYVSGIEIMTTRFSDYGFRENKEWREERGMKGCIYGTPKMVSSNVDEGVPMFVIEMNNNRNRIEGIGFMINRSCEDNYKRRIHSSDNLNRYIYEGVHRLDKDRVTDEYHKNVIWVLEMLLFKGAKHSKRSIGITRLPDWLKYNKFEYNFGEVLWEMFVKYVGIERHDRCDRCDGYERYEMREINEK